MVANYFCEDWWGECPDREGRYVFVMDGGSCFFQVLSDPEPGTALDHAVNGEA